MKSFTQKERDFLNTFFTNEKSLIADNDIEFLKSYHGVLPDWAIKYFAVEHNMIENFVDTKESKAVRFFTLSHGLSSHSYDARLDKVNFEDDVALGSTIERLTLPPFIQAEVWNKSTMARIGIWQPNTIIEAGWKGHLTLEIKAVKFEYMDMGIINDMLNCGVVSIRFVKVPMANKPYDGKYQNQPNEPVNAK
jgi:dCTP deaminase